MGGPGAQYDRALASTCKFELLHPRVHYLDGSAIPQAYFLDLF